MRGIGDVMRRGGEVRARAKESEGGVKVKHFVGRELTVESERVENGLRCGEQGAFARGEL